MPHFKHGSIEGDVREATVRDDLHAQIIEQRLLANAPVGGWGFWKPFARLVSQTCQATGLPFDPATLHEAEQDALDAAYEWFMGAPKRLRQQWEKACDEADRPVSDTADDRPNG